MYSSRLGKSLQTLNVRGAFVQIVRLKWFWFIRPRPRDDSHLFDFWDDYSRSIVSNSTVSISDCRMKAFVSVSSSRAHNIRREAPLKRLIDIYVFVTFFVTDVCWLNIRPKRHPWLAICTASGVNHNRWAFFATLQSKNQNKSHCDADEVTYVVG